MSYLPSQPSSDVYLKILAGDEVIQVNDQIVVRMAAHVCCFYILVLENFQIRSQYLVSLSGGVEQSKPYKEAAGESQRSNSGPEEDPRVGPTYASTPGFIHTGQTL